MMLQICPPPLPLLTLGSAAVPTKPSVLDYCSASGRSSSMTGIVQALLFTALGPTLLGQRRYIHNNK